jgi:hypothetical protein
LAWSSEHLALARAIGVVSIVALWFGCFDGAGALGYPCASDDDCGPTLACENTGCCGGACLFGTDGTDSTTTTGDPDSSSTSSSTTEDPTTSEGSSSSSSTGEPAECGNGDVEEGEECDLGAMNEDGDFAECNVQCRAPLFHFTSETPSDDDFCGMGCEPWHRSQGQEGPWASGPYEDIAITHRLVSREFPVPQQPPPDKVPMLQLQHEFDFNICMTDMVTPEYFDGGRVLLIDAKGQPFHLSPGMDDTYAHPPDCAASDTPWCPMPPPFAFNGTSDGQRFARLAPIPQALWGSDLRLVFEIAFDSGEGCLPPFGTGGGMSNPWMLYEVVVAFAPPEPG